jgi:hypothetical protein
MAFYEIFKDDNKYNEKNIIGFLSFAVMVIFALADLITGVMGKPLKINDYIYNSFVMITLGSFGISELGKIFSNKEKKETDEN